MPLISSMMSLTPEQEAQLMLTNLHDAFKGQSRSRNIVPFHMLGIASYLCAMVTLVFNTRRFSNIRLQKNVVTLKSGSEVTEGY